MSTATAPQVFNVSEPIPGYHTQERIGAGGYGEVWRAEAPGGIAKAIKIVYGYRDDERAARELHALNRIKEVRHPFLLSLERIELVDGHLVIVAELATSSMKALFEQYRQSGVSGIPRGELISHLRDAAEALDYICQGHSLQHLDIKPENLLLVGGRVKVADFGQVKDLQDVHSSIVSGLTPIYAAPELFDGRPNNHSDQYSLAIVYQEMLTGILPFGGRTTAQLAAQHLHSRPHLDCLPASDQATIARALSKDPKQRFSTCCEMIDGLLEVTPNRHFRTTRPAIKGQGYYGLPAAPVATEVLARGDMPAANAANATPASILSQAQEPAPTVRDLPPLDLGANEIEYHPTVFVGIGGLAVKVIHTLHGRLVERFGDISEVSALQVLVFDTDAETLEAATKRDEPSSLPDNSAILLPLRQPAEYRDESSNHQQWLSRRWIYNIPRSGQTQGFRPLGRLALVDHFDRVRDRILRAIKASVEPEGLAASAQKTGLAFRERPPRVFIVSSISGGTGSGMVLDIAYLARKVLRDLGLSDENVWGILAHVTSRNPQNRDLAVANAYSLLDELHHYSDPQHAYPGAVACGLPAFAPQDAPFTHAYVIHLGEDLEQDDFAAEVEKLARYLYCNSVTSAGAFFEHCRNAQHNEGSPANLSPAVRTFGLCQLGFSLSDVPTAVTDDLCTSLLARWRGKEPPKLEESPASLTDPAAILATRSVAETSAGKLRAEVAARAQADELDLDPLVRDLRTAAFRELGADPETYLLNLLNKLADDQEPIGNVGSGLSPSEQIVQTLDAVICSQDTPDGRRVCLESLLEKQVGEMSALRGNSLREWIVGLAASPKHRVEGAQQAVHQLTEHLRALGRQADDSAQSILEELRSLGQALLSDKKGRWLQYRGFGPWRKLVLDPQLLLYFHLQIERAARKGVCRFASSILTQVTALDDSLRNLAADLNRLFEECDRTSNAAREDSTNDGRENRRRLAVEIVAARKAEMVLEMELELECHLRRVVTSADGDVRNALSPVLRATARQTVIRALKRINLRTIGASTEGHDRWLAFSLAAGLKAATPRLDRCGGARRLLLITPEADLAAQWTEQLGGDMAEPPTVIADADEDVLLCYEAEQLPLDRVAAAVLDGRTQLIEGASRLHTRIDVPWSVP